MISDLKQTFNKSFFQEISEEWSFWKWNTDKTIFEFNLEPELLFGYCTYDENDNTYDESFINRLHLLFDIWVLLDYKKGNKINYSLKELVSTIKDSFHYINNENADSYFEYIYDNIWYTYLLRYNISKLNLLKNIIYNTKSLKHNISLWLIKAILSVIRNENVKIDIDKSNDIVDIEVLVDHLKIDDDLYVFHDFELLIYALSTYKRKYIAKVLNFLLQIVDEGNKNILLKSIKLDDNFYYLSNNDIKTNSIHDAMNALQGISKAEQYKRDILENWEHEWEVYYKEDSKIKNKKIVNYSVRYDFNSKLLEYNWKQWVFSWWWIQINFIEELYKNINNCVTEESLKKIWIKDPQDKLKAIRRKLESQYWVNQFTWLETRSLISDFKYNGVKYYIMHW